MPNSEDISIEGLTAHWDTSSASVGFNDVCNSIIQGGVAIYESTFHETWSGIWRPDVYSGSTLWDKTHDSYKIKRVIEHWKEETPLSPPFFVKHGGDHDLALVGDGKHRLTVSSAINAERVPFMVGIKDSEWVQQAFPAARLILELEA